jgi:hypothetical protein
MAVSPPSLRGALATKQSIFLSDGIDCFAEPVIGRRFAPTRGLAMTARELSEPLSCIAKNAGSMARDLLNCYAGGADITFRACAAQFTHN